MAKVSNGRVTRCSKKKLATTVQRENRTTCRTKSCPLNRRREGLRRNKKRETWLFWRVWRSDRGLFCNLCCEHFADDPTNRGQWEDNFPICEAAALLTNTNHICNRDVFILKFIEFHVTRILPPVWKSARSRKQITWINKKTVCNCRQWMHFWAADTF